MTNNQQSHGTRLLRNAFWNGLPSVFSMAVGFFLARFILSHVNTDHYGIWRLSFSLLSASWILQIGLNSAINREVPQGLVRKDFKRISEVVSTTFGFYAILSIIILAGTVLLIFKFPQWFHVAKENYTTSRIVIGMTGLGFAVWAPFVVFQAVMNGLQSFAILGIVNVLATILYALSAYLLLRADGGIIALTGAGVANLILPVVAFTIIVKYLCPQTKILIQNVHFSVFRSILPYSFNSFIYTIANTLFVSGSIWVTGSLLGTTMTTYYSICAQLTGLIGGFLTLTLVVAKPAASQFQAQDDMERVRILLLRSVKYMVMASLLPCLFLCVFRQDVIMVWLNRQDFVEVSYLIPILAVTQVAWLSQQANYFVINGVGRHRAVAVMAVCSTVMSIVLATLFVKVTSLGLLAVALGISLPMLVVSLFVIPVYSCRVFEISIAKYLKTCFLRPILPIFLFWIFIALWKNYAVTLGLGQLMLCALTGTLIAFAGYWFLALEKSEKAIFKASFRNFLGH